MSPLISSTPPSTNPPANRVESTFDTHPEFSHICHLHLSHTLGPHHLVYMNGLQWLLPVSLLLFTTLLSLLDTVTRVITLNPKSNHAFPMSRALRRHRIRKEYIRKSSPQPPPSPVTGCSPDLISYHCSPCSAPATLALRFSNEQAGTLWGLRLLWPEPGSPFSPIST